MVLQLHLGSLKEQLVPAGAYFMVEVRTMYVLPPEFLTMEPKQQVSVYGAT